MYSKIPKAHRYSIQAASPQTIQPYYSDGIPREILDSDVPDLSYFLNLHSADPAFEDLRMVWDEEPNILDPEGLLPYAPLEHDDSLNRSSHLAFISLEKSLENDSSCSVEAPIPYDQLPAKRAETGYVSISPYDSTLKSIAMLPQKAGRRLKPEAAQKNRRNRISSEKRATLEHYFQRNPYPSRSDIDTIAQELTLPPKTVKNWFSNARARKNPERSLVGQEPCISAIETSPHPYPNTPLGSRQSCTAEGNEQNCTFEEGIEIFTATSPTPSNISLERYLASSPEEEPVSIEAIEANMAPGTLPSSDTVPQPCSPLSEFGSFGDAYSSAGSYSSNISVESAASYASATSRSSRKGRRRWPHPPKARPLPSSPLPSWDLPSRLPPLLSSNPPSCPPSPSPNTVARTQFPCTVPDCSRVFTTQYEWLRHENSVHYAVKTWVCCRTPISVDGNDQKVGDQDLDMGEQFCKTFSKCLQKPESERTFSRRDHLVQHLRNSHQQVPETVVTQMATQWEQQADVSSNEHLGCYACDVQFETWETRKKHFSRHFNDGLFIWTKEHVARTRGVAITPPSVPENTPAPFTCPLCSTTFTSFPYALTRHGYCKAWSCEFLESPNSIWAPATLQYDRCKLCSVTIPVLGDLTEPMRLEKRAHYESHKLQTCTRGPFTSFQEFCAHLQYWHNARLRHPKEKDFAAWECGIKSSYSSDLPDPNIGDPEMSPRILDGEYMSTP
ncbi:uncharacterized protein BDR25DRAFT_340931 [Lindgomyces ingoldianus]|uniref:Uncharacterized protein n=1 Tax=Lindgomyces ingoldianus TaxID=673940 RepID=A0ACB6R2P6_9PLEO|nr:uncharacterized protein BDR25DRAFT_340931 [Lindgomyces ingoldianus]KAF2473553.1 hypothetical protein BDR25DRAFT_340931 [Lindgomyces ingoldianus]